MTEVVGTVYLIEFQNESLEEDMLDGDVFKTIEMAEQALFEGGYEKKFDGANRVFYERNGAYWRYGSILKRNVIG